MSKAIQSDNVSHSIDAETCHNVSKDEVFGQLSDYTGTFLEAVAREADVTDYQATPRVIDAIGVETEKQLLVEYPEGERIFIGRDETSKDAGLFAIIIDSPQRSVRTVPEALDLLKPAPVTASMFEEPFDTGIKNTI